MGFREFYTHYLKGLHSGGANRQVKCPFHEDKNPSFSVNLETGQCKCFGCGFEGDAFSFYEKLRGVGFKEAKRELAKWGIKPLKERPPTPTAQKKTNTPSPISEQTVERFVKALSGKAVEFLKEKRGLSEEVMGKYKIGWMAQKKRFSIPVSNNENYVNIRLWSPTNKPKMLPWSDGRGISLFPLDQLERNGEVLLCEGEMDALCAISHGLAAVTVTCGAGSWQDEWTPLFKGKKVNIVYDCDSAGRTGAAKIGKILLPVAEEVRVVDLGLEDEEDVTDWFVKYKKTAKELTELVEVSQPLANDTPKVSLETVKTAFQKWLYIEDSELLIIDVMLAAILANRLSGDPIWLFIVAPPGGAKTEILRSLEDYTAEIYTISTLTENALISGKQTDKFDPSLLPHLDKKVLVIKDFTAIL
ncbi:MAG: toprim domain-containing protein, partial [Candidatus Latescibacteria bacterium]|nr:toprim domain-containing protein [Candidatus Latescibacterota bacterium]